MIVVSDTSPVLSLALIGQLDVLRQLYGTLIIPQAVHDELVIGGAAYGDGEQVVGHSWIEVRATTNHTVRALLERELDRGEAEALALAIELRADLVLIDEFKGRRLADYLKVPHAGLVDLLGEAKHLQVLAAVKPTLDDLMQRANFRVGRKLYERILANAGESEHDNAA